MSKLKKIWALNISAILGWLNFALWVFITPKINEIPITGIDLYTPLAFIFNLLIIFTTLLLLVIENTLKNKSKWAFNFGNKEGWLYSVFFFGGLSFCFLTLFVIIVISFISAA